MFADIISSNLIVTLFSLFLSPFTLPSPFPVVNTGLFSVFVGLLLFYFIH